MCSSDLNGCDVSALQRVGTARRMGSRLSAVLREALIRFSRRLLAVGALEPANGKVTSRHLLEMLDERVVHGSAAQAGWYLLIRSGRVIDVTPAVARLLGFSGLAQVAINAGQ